MEKSLTKKFFRLGVQLLVVILSFGLGAVSWHAIEKYNRNVTAMLVLADAREHIQRGNLVEAIFFSGSAVTLSSSPFILLSAGDIVLEANEPHLAKHLLATAMSTVAKDDPPLKHAVARSLDKASKLIASEK